MDQFQQQPSMIHMELKGSEPEWTNQKQTTTTGIIPTGGRCTEKRWVHVL